MEVLSKLLDKAATTSRVGYHPRCKTLGLTHLSFVDDLMVLTDGKVRSIEGILHVFEEFSKYSGLKISLEKSTLYLAGITEACQVDIRTRFPFEVGTLSVRYLGLPLLTKMFTSGDYQPLLDQIKKRISSWTSQFLSFSGRLNLIASILWSIANFWLAAFRLPRACIREIDKLYSAFLWSGPALNPHKAKVVWVYVCKPRTEGGLGLRSLTEANKVCCLKLIWRIISNSPSLWVKWVHTNLLRQESFWSIRETTTIGSWIWRKLLKYRAVAKSLCKTEVGNGASTFFWFENWSSLGYLLDITGVQGIIAMGIRLYASLTEVWSSRRRRTHKIDVFNQIENALWLQKNESDEYSPDVVLWRGKGNMYKTSFSTKDTWEKTCIVSQQVVWHEGVWFPHATPKHSFCTWPAMQNCLSTTDRIRKLTPLASTCVLCNSHMETRDHMFFSCSYSAEVWSALAHPLLRRYFSMDWQTVINLIVKPQQDCIQTFLTRYNFQLSLHSLWLERNGRKHGDPPTPAPKLISSLDRKIRNKLLVIQKEGDKKYEASLKTWLACREY